jgi:3-methylfumaryl-CoA hydratase
MTGTFASWIGRSVTRTDVATARLSAEYRATLDPFLFTPPDANACPPGLHWGLAPATPGMAELGPDGSEAKGLFLPPIPLPRRMWAGGSVESFAPICLGAEVTRVSTISGVKMRDGKAGPLCFVSVMHEIGAGATLLVRERHDLVFREGLPKTARPAAGSQAARGDAEWTVEPSAAMLFRFSAFTFNGHRVHYDFPYAVQQEGYGGLIVHGPLQAALLFNQASVLLGHVPKHFDYRCIAPLVAGPAISVRSTRDEDAVTGRIVGSRGTITAEGRSF